MAEHADNDDFVIISDQNTMGLQDIESVQPDLGYLPFKMGKKGRKIQVFLPTLEVDTGVPLHASKTIGLITSRHEKMVLMTAQSGWSTGPKRDERCLDTSKWNHLALRK
jgi:hypothetical protein